MPAQTTDGIHIITKGELLEMLAQFDDHDRIRVVIAMDEEDIRRRISRAVEEIVGDKYTDAIDDEIADIDLGISETACIDYCRRDAQNGAIQLVLA